MAVYSGNNTSSEANGAIRVAGRGGHASPIGPLAEVVEAKDGGGVPRL